MNLCTELNLPVAFEKIEWADSVIIFLGILLNGVSLTLSIPVDKQKKAIQLLNDISGKKKITIQELQVLTGYLNFLTKAIFPGRTFTHCMYLKYANLKNTMDKNGKLKPHHHVKIDTEFRFDCEIWQTFLTNYRNHVLCCPMVDLQGYVTAKELHFHSDASANKKLGFGAIYDNRWIFA